MATGRSANARSLLILRGGGGSGAGPGAAGVGTILIPYNGAGTYTSTKTLPANSVVSMGGSPGGLDVQVAGAPGSTIQVGVAGTLGKFMAAGDNNPTITDLYVKPQQTSQVLSTAVVVTVTGAGGSGQAIVEYTVPDT